jgi:YgiT-type zinc finger domain-containing protein
LITAKRELDMKNLKYPKSYECMCGHEALLSRTDVTTKFRDTLITVKNVPAYECASNHVKMARITRVTVKKLLKEAYTKGEASIDYREE